MVHAFLLFVFVGLGDDKRLVSNDMYFRSVDSCIYYAQRLHHQGQLITSYCIPKLVPKGMQIYD